MLDVASRSSPDCRTVHAQRRTNSTSLGATKCDEHRYSSSGQLGSRPAWRQNSSRVVDGRIAKKSSNRAAPTTTTRSAGTP
jgi:hypothetical protein